MRVFPRLRDHESVVSGGASILFEKPTISRRGNIPQKLVLLRCMGCMVHHLHSYLLPTKQTGNCSLWSQKGI